MIDKIYKITIICMFIAWIGLLAYAIFFGDLFKNNSQEEIENAITPPLSRTLKIPEYNKKLDYLWSKLSEKERCRFEDENKMYNVQAVADEKGVTVSRVYSGDCTKWLEKTESKYLIP